MENQTEITSESAAARLEKIAEAESLLKGERVWANPPKERNDLQLVEVRAARAPLSEIFADILEIVKNTLAKKPGDVDDAAIAKMFSEVAKAPQKTPENLNGLYAQGNAWEQHKALVESASYTLLALLTAQNRLGMDSNEYAAQEPFLKYIKGVLSRSNSSRDLARQGDKELNQEDKAKYFAEDAAGYFTDAQPILEALNHALASAYFVNSENEKGNPPKIEHIGNQLKRYLPEGSLPRPLSHLMSDFQTSLEGKGNSPIFDELVKKNADRIAPLLQRSLDIEKSHPKCTEYIGCCLPYFEKYERFASPYNESLFEEMLVIIEDQLAFIERNAEPITNKLEADKQVVAKAERDAATLEPREKLAKTANAVSQLEIDVPYLENQEKAKEVEYKSLRSFCEGAAGSISAILNDLGTVQYTKGMFGSKDKALERYRGEITAAAARLNVNLFPDYDNLKKSQQSQSQPEQVDKATKISADSLTEMPDIAAKQIEQSSKLEALSGEKKEIEKRVDELNSQTKELYKIADGLYKLAKGISALSEINPDSVKKFVDSANKIFEEHSEALAKITTSK